MKKSVDVKKLMLSKETLRALEEPELLKAINGGITLGTCYNSCAGTTCGTRYC
ncbi:MAG: hypothetical protein ACLGI9_01105 [Thermoanaerobaculia bacterium]